MITSLERNAAITLKPGAVLNVMNATSEYDAKREVTEFLRFSKRDDLGYFIISKNYFLLYLKSTRLSQRVA